MNTGIQTLYLDITSGISGDMFLACLLSISDNHNECDELSIKLSQLLNKSINIQLVKTYRNAIACNKLNIDCQIDNEPFRYLKHIEELILKSKFSKFVKDKSIACFTMLAEVESQIHGIDINDVHFHEIGAVDTIIDIVGTTYLIEKLNINNIQASIIPLGHGIINTMHGKISLPAPATLRLLHGIPTKRLDIEGELVTPTGAVLLKEFISQYQNTFIGIPCKDIYVTGSYQFPNLPNILRGIILHNKKNYDQIIEIETNIDDMTGENLAYLQKKLFDSNALDVIFIPAFSKKNRPIYILKVLLKKHNLNDITNTIFKYSSTAGFRVAEVDRIIADRDFIQRQVLGYTINIKRLSYNGNVSFSPEWEDCKKVADILGISPNEVMILALKDINYLSDI